MASIIIWIITLFLVNYDVISPYTAIAIVIASPVAAFIATGLYFKFGFLKDYYHDLLGWHAPDDSPKWFDGLSDHAKCRHCGKDIILDSQGTWF